MIKKISIVAILLAQIAFIHSQPPTIYGYPPIIEFWNRTNSTVYIGINSSSHYWHPNARSLRMVKPNERYYANPVDFTILSLHSPKGVRVFEIMIAYHERPQSLDTVRLYKLNSYKTAYVELKEKNGKFLFGPQKGNWFTYETASGLSLANNVQKKDIILGTNKSLHYNDPLFQALNNNDLASIITVVNQETDKEARAQRVNRPIIDNYTPLCHAVIKGSIAIITYLLENGACVDVQTDDGYSPLSIAHAKNMYCDYTDIINLLELWQKKQTPTI